MICNDIVLKQKNNVLFAWLERFSLQMQKTKHFKMFLSPKIAPIAVKTWKGSAIWTLLVTITSRQNLKQNVLSVNLIIHIKIRVLTTKILKMKLLGRRTAAKQKRNEFVKLFAENKHRFDLSCDNCSTVFESLEEARNHYSNEHNNQKGYIKCCNVKLTYRCEVVRHLCRHLDPNKFK